MFFIVPFQALMHKETSRLESILYLVYFDFLLCNVFIVSEIYIGGRFLEDCFIASPYKLYLLLLYNPCIPITLHKTR